MTRCEEMWAGNQATQICLVQITITTASATVLLPVPSLAHVSDTTLQFKAPTFCLCILDQMTAPGFFLLLLLLSYFFVRYNHALIKPLWYVSALILKATKWSPIPIRLLHSCFWTVSKKTRGCLHRSYRRHTVRWPSVCKYPYSLFSTTGTYDLLLPN